MDSEAFVKAVSEYIMKPAALGVIENAMKPRRRRPSSDELSLSEWVNSLDQEALAFLRRLADQVAHAAIFGIFVAIDGERKIDDEGGTYELSYRKGSDRVTLMDLHDILNTRD